MPSTTHSSLKGARQHSNFQSRTAQDEAGELNRRYSVLAEGRGSPSPNERSRSANSRKAQNPYEPATNATTPPPREHSLTKRLFGIHSNDGEDGSPGPRRRSVSGRRKPQPPTVGNNLLAAQMLEATENKKANGDTSVPKPGLGPRPIGGDEKLGLFSGVYVPTCLNVLSILMFLRFGFILGLCHLK